MSHRANKALTFAQASMTRESPTNSKSRRVPRLCSLDGFTEKASKARGVDPRKLEPLTQLWVKTLGACYQVTVLDAFRSRILIQGGELFPAPTEVKLCGASLGRSFLKIGCILLGFQMELHSGDCTIATAPVDSIEVEDGSGPDLPLAS